MLVIGSDAVKMSDQDYISVSYTAVSAQYNIPQRHSQTHEKIKYTSITK
jgi:hypothetical protein